LVDLVKEEIDVAIRFSGTRLKDSSLLASKLGDLASGIYASPQYLARKGTPRTPHDLHDHEWVTFTRVPSPIRFGEGKSRVDVTPTGRITSSEILFVRALLREGAGLGFLPEFLAQEDLASGNLVRVVPQSSIRLGAIWFVRPAVRHTPAAVAAFREFMSTYLQARPLVPNPGK
jgi:DNA-binding transcriptional LysR family regulator